MHAARPRPAERPPCPERCGRGGGHWPPRPRHPPAPSRGAQRGFCERNLQGAGGLAAGYGLAARFAASLVWDVQHPPPHPVPGLLPLHPAAAPQGAGIACPWPPPAQAAARRWCQNPIAKASQAAHFGGGQQPAAPRSPRHRSMMRCEWDAGGSERGLRPCGLRLAGAPEQDQAARAVPSITPALGGAGAALRGASSHRHPHRQSSPPWAKRPLCLPPPSLASRFLKKGFCPVDHMDQRFPPAPFTVSLPPSPLGEAHGAAQSRGCLPSSPASQRRRWKPLRCSRFCF